jgi:phosphoribosyl 1,2-cyclic phosphodiesterase
VRAFVLGSGSSGNALLVEAGDTRILVDAGVGPHKLEARLARLGAALYPRGIDAIVPTHHHGDHFAQAERLAVALRAPIWVHPGIDLSRLSRPLDLRTYAMGRPFRIGDVELTTERVPHDAPHVALRLATPHHAFGVAVDVGHVTRDVVSLLASCDAAIVEANHCAELLQLGEYPQHLKRRISSGYGHLSNTATADLASRLSGSRLTRLYLGHLSRENNTPERALDVVSSSAKRIDVAVLAHGSSEIIDVRTRPGQLALPFA